MNHWRYHSHHVAVNGVLIELTFGFLSSRLSLNFAQELISKVTRKQLKTGKCFVYFS